MSEKLEDMTKEELYDLAQERDLEGRSTMDKAELVAALQATENDHDHDHGSAQDTSAGHTETVEPVEQTTDNGGFQVQGAGESGSDDGLGDIPEADGSRAVTDEVNPVLDSEADYSEPTVEYADDVNPVKSRQEEEDEQHERRKAADAEIEARQAAARTNPW